MQAAEPYGTTPFPILTSESRTPYHVKFDPSKIFEYGAGRGNAVTPQQPQTQQIAVFEASPNEESINGASTLAVNQHFVCYSVKNGLIRVLHRHSTLRTLLRAHSGQRVTDIQFFQDGDIVATAGSSDSTNGSNMKASKIVIWRVFERSPEIMSEKMLEIHTDKFCISRVLWHPFNPNQFWMVHRDNVNANVATLVESTRIATTQHPTEKHPLCTFYDDFTIMKDAMQLKPPSSSSSTIVNLTDLCWNGRDTRYVLAVYDSGQIVLWDLQGKQKLTPDIVGPSVIGEVFDDSDGGLSRCFFLPHEDSAQYVDKSEVVTSTTCFVTAAKKNSSLTLWSAWHSNGNTPSKLQTISLVGTNNPSAGLSSSYILDVCFGPAPPDASPPSCFIVVADREAGRLFAFHCRSQWSTDDAKSHKRALLAGCDYVVPFTTKHPTYSWNVICSPTQDISEEELSEQGSLIFDMKLFSYQSTVVQCLTLTSLMCLPPASTWTDPTPGVTVELIRHTGSKEIETLANISDFESDDDVMYDEDYDIEDEEDEYDGAPEASALPPPEGIAVTVPNSRSVSPPLAQNPFANWLGAIAAKTIGGNPPPLPPPPQEVTAPSASSPLAPQTQSFLSPMDILAGQAQPQASLLPKAVPIPSSNARSEILNSRDPTPTATNKQTEQKSKTVEKSSMVSKEKAIIKKAPQKQAIPKLASSSPAEGKFSILKRDVNIDTTTDVEKSIPSTEVRNLVQNTSSGLDGETIRRFIREEMLDTVVPSIQQAITNALPAKTANAPVDIEMLSLSLSPLQASIDAIAKQGIQMDNDKIVNAISDSVHEPIRSAFTDSIKNVFIPVIESVTTQVLVKVSKQLEVTSALRHQENDSFVKEMETMSSQLSTMTQLFAKLTDEVQSLRREVALTTTQTSIPIVGSNSTSNSPQSVNVPQIDAMEVRRKEILSLLREHNFELAFTKAVEASTAEMVVYCCQNADLNEVLGGRIPVLSQPILLCLMQQLGTVLISSEKSALELEMDWLQEIIVSLNTNDPSIQKHVSGVFQQVVNHINHKLNAIQGTSQNQLNRQLQRMLQLIRGQSIGGVPH